MTLSFLVAAWYKIVHKLFNCGQITPKIQTSGDINSINVCIKRQPTEVNSFLLSGNDERVYPKKLLSEHVTLP